MDNNTGGGSSNCKDTTMSFMTYTSARACSSQQQSPSTTVDLTNVLPTELIQRILVCLPYDNVANIRGTSKLLDSVCRSVLNQGFRRLEQHNARSLSLIKSQLPRRESERRNHALARHNDIATAVETRLSLLSMTYSKYIDLGVCCFIPGRVLDEAFNVLRAVDRSLTTNEPPGRPHELLQELRDISSMAMEQFDEHIAPALRDATTPKFAAGSPRLGGNSKQSRDLRLRLDASGLLLTPTSAAANDSACSALSTLFGVSSAASSSHNTTQQQQQQQHLQQQQQQQHDKMRMAAVQKQVTRLDSRIRAQNIKLNANQTEIAYLRAAQTKSETKLRDQGRRITSQKKLIGSLHRKLDEMSKSVKDLSRRVLEYSSLLSDTVTDMQAGSGGAVLIAANVNDNNNNSAAGQQPSHSPPKPRRSARKRPNESGPASSNADSESTVSPTKVPCGKRAKRKS